MTVLTSEKLIETGKDFVEAFMPGFSVEQRLKDISVEQRLKGVSIKELLKSVSVEEVLKEIPLEQFDDVTLEKIERYVKERQKKET